MKDLWLVIISILCACGNSDHSPGYLAPAAPTKQIAMQGRPDISTSISLGDCKPSGRKFSLTVGTTTESSCTQPLSYFDVSDTCAWGMALLKEFPAATQNDVRLFVNVSLFEVEGLMRYAVRTGRAGTALQIFADYKSNVWTFDSNGEYREFCVEKNSKGPYDLKLVTRSLP